MAGRRGLIAGALVLLAVLFPVNAGAIQGAGGTGATWWVIGGLLFAIPSTVVILALAARDGSPFVSMQQGHRLAHAGAVAIWIAGSLAVLSAAVATVTYAARALAVQPPVAVAGLLALGLAVLGTLAGRRRWWGAALVGGAAALILAIIVGVVASLSAAPEIVATPDGWFDLSGGLSWIGLVVLGLVGAHEPFQRAGLRPIPARAIWIGMLLTVIGYVALTLAVHRALPADVAVGFTSLADLGGARGTAGATAMAVLICLSFAATTLGTGAVFRELQSDLRLPRGSLLTLITVTAVGCFLLLPALTGSDDADTSAAAYAVTQGAVALLWALGYVALGGLGMRVVRTPAVRVSGVLTIVFGAVGAVSVLTSSFTPLLSTGAWAAWVVALSLLAVVIAWVLKAEHDHHAHPVDVPPRG